MLSEDRKKAVRAAMRAHHERTHTPSQFITDKARLDIKKNPDLDGNMTDLIADVLILAGDLGLSPLDIMSAAISHVPGDAMNKAHAAIGRIRAAQAKAAA